MSRTKAEHISKAKTSELISIASELRNTLSSGPDKNLSKNLEMVLGELTKRGWEAKPYDGYSFSKGNTNVVLGHDPIMLLCVDSMDWIKEEEEKLKQKKEPFVIEKDGSKTVIIEKDGRCNCDCATPCPLHKVGTTYRCTEAELKAAGIKTQRKRGKK